MKYFLLSLLLLSFTLNSVVPLENIMSGEVSKDQLHELLLHHDEYEKELLARFITKAITVTQELDRQDPNVLLGLMAAYERVILFEISSESSTQAFNKMDKILKILQAERAQSAVYNSEEMFVNQECLKSFKGKLKKIFKLSLVSEETFFSTYEKALDVLNKDRTSLSCEEILAFFDENEQNFYLVFLQNLLFNKELDHTPLEVFQELAFPEPAEPSGCLACFYNFLEQMEAFLQTYTLPGIGNEGFYSI